jgi:hypothetical protein
LCVCGISERARPKRRASEQRRRPKRSACRSDPNATVCSGAGAGAADVRVMNQKLPLATPGKAGAKPRARTRSLSRSPLGNNRIGQIPILLALTAPFYSRTLCPRPDLNCIVFPRFLGKKTQSN